MSEEVEDVSARTGEFVALTKDGGVKKRILIEGEEPEYMDDDEFPPKGAMVQVHYQGELHLCWSTMRTC